MSRSFGCWLPVVLVAALAAAGCGDDETTTPTDPTPVDVTETFTGTINPNGAATHTFITQRSGTVTASVVTLSPDNTVSLGLALGIWDGVNCQVVVARDVAPQGAFIQGTATSIGSLCVRVYDVGRFTEATSYEVQVIHP